MKIESYWLLITKEKMKEKLMTKSGVIDYSKIELENPDRNQFELMGEQEIQVNLDQLIERVNLQKNSKLIESVQKINFYMRFRKAMGNVESQEIIFSYDCGVEGYQRLNCSAVLKSAEDQMTNEDIKKCCDVLEQFGESETADRIKLLNVFSGEKAREEIKRIENKMYYALGYEKKEVNTYLFRLIKCDLLEAKDELLEQL